MLCDVVWQLVAKVSGQPIAPIFDGQAVFKQQMPQNTAAKSEMSQMYFFFNFEEDNKYISNNIVRGSVTHNGSRKNKTVRK